MTGSRTDNDSAGEPPRLAPAAGWVLLRRHARPEVQRVLR